VAWPRQNDSLGAVVEGVQPGICGIVGKMAHDCCTGLSVRETRRLVFDLSRAPVCGSCEIQDLLGHIAETSIQLP
jgi:hypothetical protein